MRGLCRTKKELAQLEAIISKYAGKYVALTDEEAAFCLKLMRRERYVGGRENGKMCWPKSRYSDDTLIGMAIGYLHT